MGDLAERKGHPKGLAKIAYRGGGVADDKTNVLRRKACVPRNPVNAMSEHCCAHPADVRIALAQFQECRGGAHEAICGGVYPFEEDCTAGVSIEHHGDPVFLNQEVDIADCASVEDAARLHNGPELARQCMKRSGFREAFFQFGGQNPRRCRDRRLAPELARA